MDQVKALFAIVLLVVITFSCSTNGKFADEINTVDSLITVVEDYQASLNSNNLDTLNAKLEVVNDRMDYLSQNYPDSTDRDFWITKMNYLRQVQKAYQRHGENRPSLSRQIEESLRQLKTLRNSLEDEKLTEEEAEKYVQDEMEVVSELRFNTQKITRSVESGNEIWDSLRPYFDSVAVYYRSRQVQ